ncbi:hypothetical protein ABFX02_08G025000 [Erythranthe guttata]
MEKFSGFNKNEEQIELPPGFRFHPTDEELITHYLCPKVIDGKYITKAIGDVDLNKVEPWDLPWKAKMGEKEWYFFCVRDRKYPTGLRTNRATEAGYWKATGKDKEIFRGKFLVGMKKTLVFYKGRAPKGEKTNWVMHEYRLEGKHSLHNLPKTANNEWVICRIFKKSSDGKIVPISGLARSRNCGVGSEAGSDLPQLMDFSSDENHIRTTTCARASEGSHVTCFSNPMEEPRDITPFDDFSSSSSSRNFHFSPFPFVLPQNSVYLDSKSFPNTKRNGDGEFSQDMCSAMSSYNDVGYLPYEDQEFPIISTAQVDIDCLWNY